MVYRYIAGGILCLKKPGNLHPGDIERRRRIRLKLRKKEKIVLLLKRRLRREE
jgi:hypothetical protein